MISSSLHHYGQELNYTMLHLTKRYVGMALQGAVVQDSPEEAEREGRDRQKRSWVACSRQRTSRRRQFQAVVLIPTQNH
ncbi:hypothetical protein L2E82_31331 [Cichorium intybus]|uniref:Uncharacterized protein n=1 Tax=Cichorium intybus TaxID=13427 RepID=A0ACB9D2M6_CICIN|nr:hypothetical protein L2E82_31331 [Cichorium intybus]